jgi:hypothetical protein
MSPLLAQSRHPDRVGECPLSGVKRTSKFKSVTSAFDPKRTSAELTVHPSGPLGAAIRRREFIEMAGQRGSMTAILAQRRPAEKLIQSH